MFTDVVSIVLHSVLHILINYSIFQDNDSDATAALKCDLCAMYFVTPAEWVRHVQSTHTETELAISNNSSLTRRCFKSTTSDPQSLTAAQQQEKSCSVCKKSFPSYASMLIHKRTHTGLVVVVFFFLFLIGHLH